MSIVEQIIASGVRGIPRDPCHCIVARFMRFSGFYDVVCGRFAVGGRRWGDGFWDLPPDVTAFTLAFDNGEHPELEEP